MSNQRRQNGVVFSRKDGKVLWIRCRDRDGKLCRESTATEDWQEANRKLRERLQARDGNLLEISRAQERSRKRCRRRAHQATAGRNSRQSDLEAGSRGEAGRACCRRRFRRAANRRTGGMNSNRLASACRLRPILFVPRTLESS